MSVAVRVDVRAFENDSAGTAMLNADWSLRVPHTALCYRRGSPSSPNPLPARAATRRWLRSTRPSPGSHRSSRRHRHDADVVESGQVLARATTIAARISLLLCLAASLATACGRGRLVNAGR